MAKGYRLHFAREDLDLGELAELFSTLDELYVKATMVSMIPADYPFELLASSPSDVLPRPYVQRVSKESPWVMELIEVAQQSGGYAVGLGLLAAILRNPKEWGQLPYRFAEGWFEGRINVRKLRRELEQLGREANDLAGPITVEEIEVVDPGPDIAPPHG